ncbi:MAG: hypothetical protein OXF24_05755 [Hyphomicrobiales bacterium]|nr:hypothetical protein [Hyphomicrobiales bacterium]
MFLILMMFVIGPPGGLSWNRVDFAADTIVSPDGEETTNVEDVKMASEQKNSVLDAGFGGGDWFFTIFL